MLDKQILIARLTALHKNVEGWLRNPYRDNFDPKNVMDLFDRYVSLRNILRSEYGDFFSDLPVRDNPKPAGSDYEGRGIIFRTHLELLHMDIEYCLDALSNVPAISIPTMKATREGIFFAGQYFDALKVCADIFTNAQTNIVLIDGYIDIKVLELLSSKKPSVTVSILTKDVSPALKTSAEAFNRQFRNLSIRTSSAFHDRFIIIDDSDFYHFGASIKDLGKRGFMFSRIEEPVAINALRAKWNQEWNKARIEV